MDSDATAHPNLSQEQVFELISRKKFSDCRSVVISPGTDRHIDLYTSNLHDIFTLDVERGRVILKYTFQTRYSKTYSLVRLDVGGSHTNPPVELELGDGDWLNDIQPGYAGRRFIKEPHIHIYREGFEDKWAYRPEDLLDIDSYEDMGQVFFKFLGFCNIDSIPIQGTFDDQGRY